MIARAPGKLFVTGAYAVLEGAPAVVVAIDRYATADASRADPGAPRPEVAAVARRLGRPAPVVDTSAQETRGRKLGLGSSAAAAVAAAAAILGEDPRDLDARRRIFAVAREAHAEIQPRGSGGDVAAATFGGTVIVQRPTTGTSTKRDAAELDVQTSALPEGLVLRPFALDRSARTSDALDRLAERRDRARPAIAAIAAAADRGASALARGDVDAFVAACAAHVAGLAALGDALDLALVPPELARARRVLDRPDHPDVVLLPSGAGGGDTVLWLSARGPTHQEVSSLEELGLALIDSSVDTLGVHRLERS